MYLLYLCYLYFLSVIDCLWFCLSVHLRCLWTVCPNLFIVLVKLPCFSLMVPEYKYMDIPVDCRVHRTHKEASLWGLGRYNVNLLNFHAKYRLHIRATKIYRYFSLLLVIQRWFEVMIPGYLNTYDSLARGRYNVNLSDWFHAINKMENQKK